MLAFPDILAKFGPARRTGKEWRVRCPVHGDDTPSLDIAEGRDSVAVFQCRSAGCDTGAILAAVGLTWADISFEPPHRNGHGPAEPQPWDAVHDYRDLAGVLRYRIYRRGTGRSKVIRQQRASDGAWSMDGVERLPYRLDELVDVTTVVIAEGEKCVDRLWALGIPATCNTGGAKKWRPSDTAWLHRAGVTDAVILPDADDDGAAHAAQVAARLAELGIPCRPVALPGLEPKGDVVDWLQTHTPDELRAALAPPPPPSLDLEHLADAVQVIAEGQAIADTGIQYLVDGVIPAYGMLGLLVAYAKVGKTTLGQALAAAVATGTPFLDLETAQRRVLIIAAEDPPEYTAYLARHLDVPEGVLSFYRAPIILTDANLARIQATVAAGGYGFVLIASWQAVVAGLVKDENDNAGAVAVVERVKAATRATGIPWLIDAHSGKAEDQSDDADPTKAMRGASGAAGSADYLLSLRYADGPFSPKRRLSGKGRFVNLEPLSLTYDPPTGTYSAAGAVRSATADTTWRLLTETHALTTNWTTVTGLAVRSGMATTPRDVTGAHRRAIIEALKSRPGIDRQVITKNGRENTMIRLADEP